MSDSICLSIRSKSGPNSTKRCKNKKINGSLFCGKHKNSKKIFENVFVGENLIKTNDINSIPAIQPTREITIIELNSYKENPSILKTLKIHNLKVNLKLLNLNRNGKKNELVERLKDYFEKQLKINDSISEINTLKAIAKRNFHFKMYGPSIGIRSLCINDCDYLLNENLSEIPFEQFFSYNDGKFTYGFTLSSFSKLLKWNCMCNPYNNQKIPPSAIKMFGSKQTAIAMTTR